MDKNFTQVPLNAKHKTYTSKKTGKEVSAEVFKGKITIDGKEFWLELNPVRRKRDGKPDSLWLTVGRSSGKGFGEL